MEYEIHNDDMSFIPYHFGFQESVSDDNDLAVIPPKRRRKIIYKIPSLNIGDEKRAIELLEKKVSIKKVAQKFNIAPSDIVISR